MYIQISCGICRTFRKDIHYISTFARAFHCGMDCEEMQLDWLKLYDFCTPNTTAAVISCTHYLICELLQLYA